MANFPAGYQMVPQFGGMQQGFAPLNYQMVPQYAPPVQQMQPQQPIVQMPQPQPMASAQPMVLGGKMVDSIKVVEATDIPMDNATYYFPKPDGSEIYTKRWEQDGSCKVVTYKRELEPPSEETKEFMGEFLCKGDVEKMQTSLMQKMDSILDRVSKLEEAFK